MIVICLVSLLLGIVSAVAFPFLYFAIFLVVAGLAGIVIISASLPGTSLLWVLGFFIFAQIGYGLGLGFEGLLRRFRASAVERRAPGGHTGSLSDRAVRK